MVEPAGRWWRDQLAVHNPPRCQQVGAIFAGRFLALVGARWCLPILEQLGEGGRRYQDLHDLIDGVSYKVLTETLRRAERDGLITRRLDGGRVETATLYELTDLGRSLDQPLAALAEWAEINWKAVEAAREQWDARRQAEH